MIDEPEQSVAPVEDLHRCSYELMLLYRSRESYVSDFTAVDVVLFFEPSHFRTDITSCSSPDPNTFRINSALSSAWSTMLRSLHLSNWFIIWRPIMGGDAWQYIQVSSTFTSSNITMNTFRKWTISICFTWVKNECRTFTCRRILLLCCTLTQVKDLSSSHTSENERPAE